MGNSQGWNPLLSPELYSNRPMERSIQHPENDEHTEAQSGGPIRHSSLEGPALDSGMIADSIRSNL